VGICLVLVAAIVMSAAKGCDEKAAKDGQLRREAIVKCIEAGKDPLVCEKAMQAPEQRR
jgi:uncharacterized protein YgiB involved in biofilm formation